MKRILISKINTLITITICLSSLIVLSLDADAQPTEVKIICEIVPAIYDPNFEITYQQGVLFWDSLIRYSPKNGVRIYSIADTSNIAINDPKPFNRIICNLNNLQWSNHQNITFSDIEFTVNQVLSNSRLDQFNWTEGLQLTSDANVQEISFIFPKAQRNADILTFPILPYNYNSIERSRYFEVPEGSGAYKIVAPFNLMGERHFEIDKNWHGFVNNPPENTPFSAIRLTSSDLVKNLHTCDIATDIELSYGISLAQSCNYTWEPYRQNSSIFIAFNCRFSKRYFVDSAVRKEISSYIDRRRLHIGHMGGKQDVKILPTIYPCDDKYYNSQLAASTLSIMTTCNDVVSDNVRATFKNVNQPLVLIYQDVNTFNFENLALSIASRISEKLFRNPNMVQIVGLPVSGDPKQRNSFEYALTSGNFDLALMYWNFGYSGTPNIEPLIGEGNPFGYSDKGIDRLLQQIDIIDPAQLHEKFIYYLESSFNADSITNCIEKSQSIVRLNGGESLEELKALVRNNRGSSYLNKDISEQMVKLVETTYDFDDWNTFYKTKYDLIQEHMFDNPPAIPLFNAVKCFARRKELKGVMVYQGNVFNSITEWYWSER